MQWDPNNVFGGRKVYFTEDPDIKVVYCLVRKPDPIDMPEVRVTDPRFVDTVEMLFIPTMESRSAKPCEPLTSQTRSSPYFDILRIRGRRGPLSPDAFCAPRRSAITLRMRLRGPSGRPIFSRSVSLNSGRTSVRFRRREKWPRTGQAQGRAANRRYPYSSPTG